MKGIYLTQEGKEEIEAKIAQLEKYKDSDECNDPRDWSFVLGKQSTLEEILSSAIILPVEENWVDIQNTVVSRKQLPFSYTEEYYPNGVIIKTKES